jgi:hypothetical protein
MLTSAARSGRVRIAAALLALAAQGCVSYRMYRTESLIAEPAYDLAFVELDEQGELWSPAQVERALSRIRRAGATREGAILVVFIHGWTHDAAEGDANVEGFRAWLASIAEMEAQRAPASPRRVIGVYLGWRGRTSRLGPLEVLTFFSRFGAAKRAASPATTQALYELMLAARENPHSTTVVAGHSFGGLILESALAQALIGSLAAAIGSDQTEVQFPADLILLVNPASQAIVAKQLVEISERHHLKFVREDDEGRRYEVPLVVSLTSDADTATAIFFPVGMRLRGVGKRYRDYGPELCGRARQKSYFRNTAGHQQDLLSHRLSTTPFDGGAAPGAPPRVGTEYELDTRQQVFTFTGARLRYQIRANPLSWNDTPYWIMNVPPAVLPDHSRIFGRELLELGAMLLEMTGALEDRRARLVRDDRVKPILLVAGPDGGVRFLDRSRKIYAVDPDTPEPVPTSCLPPSLAGGQDLVNLVAARQEIWVVGSLSPKVEPEDRRRMGIARLRPAGDGAWSTEARELRRRSWYEAAAFDIERERVFLARRGEPRIEVADIAHGDIDPALLVDLSATVSRIALLAYDGGSRRLFASDGRATILAIDLDGARPRVHVLGSSLDRPSALAFDGERRRLYVATSGDGALWKSECADACSAPERFASASELRRPRTLAVDAQGVLWAGDLENEIIVGFSPAGEVVHRVERLPASF